MIVKAYYAGGRIDVFDTGRMTDCVPQPNNLLTNYTLDLSDVNEESLWLRSYYYEASQAYRDELGPKDLPVARRRDGWSFLIADADDMQKLNRLTLDGETVLIQIEGELVDAATLEWAYDIVETYRPKIVLAYRHYVEGPSGKCSFESTVGIPASVLDETIARSGINCMAEDALPDSLSLS